MGEQDIDNAILNGIVFKKKSDKPQDEKKIKTKAKKLQYIHGAHGSGSAMMKAEYRRRRANRHKSK